MNNLYKEAMDEINISDQCLRKVRSMNTNNKKIKKFRFHDFRHTVATRMVEAGIDLAVVQEILGHANIQTTMRYAHPVPERKKQAIDALSSF